MPLKGKFVIQKLVKLYEKKRTIENIFPPRHECLGQSKIVLKKDFHHNYGLEKKWLKNLCGGVLFIWLSIKNPLANQIASCLHLIISFFKIPTFF